MKSLSLLTCTGRYFGLSSTGITYKSGSAALGSSSSRGGDRYGGFGNSRDADAFSDSYKDRDRFGEDSFQKSTSKTRRGATGDNFDSSLKKGTSQEGRSVITYIAYMLGALSVLAGVRYSNVSMGNYTTIKCG